MFVLRTGNTVFPTPQPTSKKRVLAEFPGNSPDLALSDKISGPGAVAPSPVDSDWAAVAPISPGTTLSGMLSGNAPSGASSGNSVNNH